jgi:hypothetical protein
MLGRCKRQIYSQLNAVVLFLMTDLVARCSKMEPESHCTGRLHGGPV